MATLAARVSPQPYDLQRRALVGLRSADAGVSWGGVIVASLLSGAIVMGAGYLIGRVTA
jgi:hypothetical protein